MATDKPTNHPILEEHARGKVSLFMAPDHGYEEGIEQMFALPDALADLEGVSTRQASRPTSWHWEPAWGPAGGLHVRQYAHGGALGKLWGTVFPAEKRMLDELRLTIFALKSGVPTARPVCVRVERIYGTFVRAHYICETVADAVNLLDFCRAEETDARMKPKARAEFTEAVARAVAALHSAGVLHADLNLKNILLRQEGWPPKAFVIDFDKSKRFPSLSIAQCMSNLRRLERSFLKWQSSVPFATPNDRLRFLRLYATHCHPPRDLRALVGAPTQ
jgi:3-deoxy-D-manno-octulosonic acid kinase